MKIQGQSLTHIGILPRINYSTRVTDRLSLNFSAFSEIDPADNQVGEEIFPSRVLNLTFAGGLGFKLKHNNIITASYLFRIIDTFETAHRAEHRITLQFVHLQILGNWHLRHHLRFEERFIESITTDSFEASTRLSYSFGWQVPLQGKHLDAKEFYLNSISSYFVQPTRPRTAFHNLTEFYLGLGYKTEKIGRFEIGPEAKLSVRNPERDLNTLIFIDLIWYPLFKGPKT